MDSNGSGTEKSRLAAFAEIGEAINRKVVLGLRSVLSEAGDVIRTFFGADYVAVYPYDPDRQRYYELDNIVIKGLKESRTRGDKPRELGLASIIRDVGELVVPDIDVGAMWSVDYELIREREVDEERLLRFIRDEKFIVEENVKAFVGISLKAGSPDEGSSEVGVLYIDYCNSHHFSENELYFIRILANQLGSAIQHARLLEHERERRQQVELSRALRTSQLDELLQIAHRIADGTGDFRSLLELIAQNLSDVFDGASCSVRLYDAETNIFGQHVSAGRLFGETELAIQPRATGASRYTIRKKQPLYVNDPLHRLESGEAAIRSEFRAVGVNSLAFLPLISRGVPVGILYLGAQHVNAFSLEEQQILELYADQATIAIEYARLFENLTQVLNGSSVPMFVLDKQHRVTIWNNACAKLTGIPKEEVLETRDQWRAFYAFPRQVMADLILEGSIEQKMESLYGVQCRRSQIVEGAYEAEDFFPGLDGGGKWLLFTAAPVKDASGNIVAAIETLQDITDRKKAEQNLRQSEERLRAIVEGSPVPAFVIDKQHQVLYWNEACAEITGVPKAEVIGHSDQWKPFYSKRRPVLADLVLRNAKDEKIDEYYGGRWRKSTVIHGAYEVVGHFDDLGGKERWVLFTAAALKDQDGIVFGAIETLLDITAEITAEERQERIKVIGETGIAVSAGSDRKTVLDTLLVKTLGLIKAGSSGQICLLNPDQNLVEVVAVQGEVQHDIKNLPLEEGVVGRVARTGKPYLIGDSLQNDPHYVPHLVGTRSELAVPLLKEGRVIGVLNVEHSKPKAYTEDDIPLLEAIAAQIVVAIEDADHRLKQLQALASIYEKIIGAGVEDVDRIVDLLYESAATIMVLDDALFYVAFYDRERDEVSFGLMVENDDGVEIDRIRWGKRSEEVVPEWLPRSRRNPPGLTEYVIHNGTSVLIPDNFAEQVRGRGIQVWPEIGRKRRQTLSWLGVPMAVGETVIGVISIQSLEQTHSFDEGHRDLLDAVADQAAIAIENARLYRETRRLAEDNARLYDEARTEAIAAKQLSVLGTASATLQHRISNDFAIIVPNVRRLRNRLDPNDSTIAEILDTIERNAKKTSATITRMMALLREVDVQVVNINAVLEEVMNSSRETWGSTVEIASELCEDLPNVTAPIGQLTEVFQNLIDNACKSMPNGGQVVVSSRHSDGEITIRVRDTGPGIPPNIRTRLLSKPVPPKEPTQGSGLGLWLSKLILESVSGSIAIENTDENGTTMRATIPVGSRRHGGA